VHKLLALVGAEVAERQQPPRGAIGEAARPQLAQRGACNLRRVTIWVAGEEECSATADARASDEVKVRGDG